jgi:predicted alternative tryptophan synthase beta-subunit
MTGERLPDELMKSLMPAAKYEAWKRQEEASREFWRTLQGPAQRPLGSNADEWHLFLAENKDAPGYLAVQIAEAIEQAERRGPVAAQIIHRP